MTLSNQEIGEYINSLEKESKAFTKHLFDLSWHMRGGMTLDEAFQISHSDREVISELIKDRVEVTNETKLPYF